MFQSIAKIAMALCLLGGAGACAETLRVASWNASLSRNGPGQLLNDLRKGEHPQIENVVAILTHIRPDIVLINEFDYDARHEAALLFADALRAADEPLDYPHIFTSPPNTGQLSGFDLNGDGKTSTAEDAFGWGKFPGQYGMLLLSRYPIADTRTFAKLLWQDLPGAELPQNVDGTPFPSAEAQTVMRLSSKSHWDIEVDVPEIGPVHVFASHPTPPVFDGPEDRNGLRNADEIRFWSHYIGGTSLPDDGGNTAPRGDVPFVILGDLNADPFDGDGIHEAISALLADPALKDPHPGSQGAVEAGPVGVNADHAGNAARDTADWNDERGPGNLRVDYVLPSSDLDVVASGVFWPVKSDPLARLLSLGKRATSDHHLVWVDIALP